jgi:acylphosphatase
MAKLLRITGVVQGVGYRVWFEAQARRLHLSGWVRNRRDGSVEAMVAGEAAALSQIVAQARRGPPAAIVDDVAVADADDSAVANGDFQLLPTL